MCLKRGSLLWGPFIHSLIHSPLFIRCLLYKRSYSRHAAMNKATKVFVLMKSW